MIRIEITGGTAMVELGTAIGLTPAILAVQLEKQLNANGVPCTVEHVEGPIVEVTLTGFRRVFQRFMAWKLRRNLEANGMEVVVTVLPSAPTAPASA